MQEIERIVAKYLHTDHSQEKLALGTVVRVEESAYRRIGARILVSSNGQWIGGISGGCLEGDALKRAKIAMQKAESSLVIYDTRDEDAHQIGVGLGCQGRIDVLFSPIDPADPNNQIELLRKIKDARTDNWLLQVIDLQDQHHESLGKFYHFDQIEQAATDLKIEQAKIQEAFKSLQSAKKSKVIRLHDQSEQSCDILFECIRPKIKLICVGDNYDVNAFAEVANTLGWELHVLGKTRKMNRRIFQLAKTVGSYEEAKKVTLDEQTALVLMSHDFQTDLKALTYYLPQEVPYIGLLGPRKRMDKLESALKEDFPDLELSNQVNIYAPVGLDIGAETPEEIALSIAAEIISVLRGRSGSPLRYRTGPIHERS